MRLAAVFTLVSILLGGTTMANTQCYQIWPTNSLIKVLQDQTKPKSADSEIILSAAKGERESAQVVIRAGEEALKGVNVTVDDLTGPGGTIPGSNIEVRRVVYINLTTLKKTVPDPLPPVKTFDVAAGKDQPVWITISTPRNAEAGLYSGEVVIRPAGAPESRIPITLKVWNFSLPLGPSLKTAFGMDPKWIAAQHGVAENSVASRRLTARYYNLLIDHWISPYSLPVPVTSPQAAEYINDPRVTSFTIPYSDNVDEIRAKVESLRQRNLLAKAYFYPTDEPVTADGYNTVYKDCKNIREAYPKARIVVPYYRDPDFDTGGKTIHELADGLINIWCPNLEYFNNHKEKLQAKLDKGEEFWWYVCCGPSEPYPNLFMTMDGPSHRVLPWLQWKYRCQGLLYWSTTYWNPDGGTSDPWVDMATVKDINKDLYGDGSLIYPGKKVDVDGPVSSIRLELLSDGLEDYEYLVLLEKKLGRARAEKFVEELVTDPTHFCHDVDKWASVRNAIGEELSK